MTEEEAKTKWCPFVRHLETVDIDGSVQATNRPQGNARPAPSGKTTCIGSSCIAWRWDKAANRIKNPGSVLAGGADGYCGLAGKP